MFTLQKYDVKPDIQAEIVHLLEDEPVERLVQNRFDTVRKLLVVSRNDHGCKIPYFIYLTLSRYWDT